MSHDNDIRHDYVLSTEYLPHVRCVLRGRTAITKKDAETLMASASNYITGKDQGTADNRV